MTTLSKLNIDLTKPFQRLARAPIVEAVIEIRARAEGSWEEWAVLHHLKPKLPDYPSVVTQREFRQEFRMGLGQPSEATTHDLGWQGLRFQSADDRHIVQFKRDGFVFSRLHPYESWEQLNREAMRLWQLHMELSHPTVAQRVGLRFINRIELPPQELRFEGYIQSAPQPPQDLDLPFIAYFQHDTLAVPGHPYAVNVIRTIQPAQNPDTEGMAVILDIDVFRLRAFDLPQQELLKQSLAEMRWLKNKVFFGSVTQKALEAFQ